MIRWCSYCQKFLGEAAPLENARFTHGICPQCEARLATDELLISDTDAVRALVRRLIRSATEGDEAACATIVSEARTLGLNLESQLMGMLQPALYQAGESWQDGCMSVAAEHRLTSWCERVFGMLPAAPHRAQRLDLLILQAPGNTHTLGPRIAARVLAERGLAVEAVVPDLPLDEMVALAKRLQPRAIGFSCATSDSVPKAIQAIDAMQSQLGDSPIVRYLLSGFAIRAGLAQELADTPSKIEVVLDFDQVQFDR